MKSLLLAVTVTSIFFIASAGLALDALEIVTEGDRVLNAPRDAHIILTMRLTDKNGNTSERRTEMYQKGSDKRLIRFLAPADQKGIGFLTLPGDVMYLYLPAFKKVRQIASHVKNQNFAGTDLTYEDLSHFEFHKTHRAEMIGEEGDTYVIKLTPLASESRDYAYLVAYYRKDNFYPVRVDYCESSGEIWKTMERTELEIIDGYWTSLKMNIKDLKKDHSTVSVIDQVEFDIGLNDDVFTKRNLIRVR
jgi:outer membrane lipoprotein-sorting protein